MSFTSPDIRRSSIRYKVEEIEKAADVVVWCCDEAPGFTPGRVQDSAFTGNIVEAIAAYGRGHLCDVLVPLSSVDRLIVIGSDGMMRAVQQARHGGCFISSSRIIMRSGVSIRRCSE